jgi:hypothetical protein
MVDNYLSNIQAPSVEELEDEYIEFIEKHPRFPRRHLRARFPNLDQLEDSQRVAKILAQKEEQRRNQAKAEKLHGQYETLLLRQRFNSLQDVAISILEKAMSGKNVTKEQLEAAKYALSGKQSYARRSGELQAETEQSNFTDDQPYPKP